MAYANSPWDRKESQFPKFFLFAKSTSAYTSRGKRTFAIMREVSRVNILLMMNLCK